MMPMRYFFTIIIFFFISCSSSEITNRNYEPRSSQGRVQRIEMHLSAFGVESDNFPNIDVIIDLSADSSYCKKWYYNPKFKDSVYSLSRAEMLIIASLIEKSDLSKLKKEYSNRKTDQPSSKTTIYFNNSTLQFSDYGLEADYPLTELYKIVYKY